MNLNYIKWELATRQYGSLQGLNIKNMIKKFGDKY